MSTNGIQATLEGDQELRLKLALVTDEMKLKGGRAALRKASKVLLDESVNQLKKADNSLTDEAIWRNAVTRFSPKRFRSSGDLMFRVGILGGSKSKESNQNNPGGDTFYWRFLEFGTEKTPAYAPMRTAVKMTEDLLVGTFASSFKKSLDRAIKKTKNSGKVKI